MGFVSSPKATVGKGLQREAEEAGWGWALSSGCGLYEPRHSQGCFAFQVTKSDRPGKVSFLGKSSDF